MRLQRKLTGLGLVIMIINGCVGSGWLFAPMFAAQIAGPCAIISWTLAGIMMSMIALTFVECAILLPLPGVSSRLPLFVHGKLTGFIISWLSWLAIVTVPPIEVQTTLQYLATYFPILTHKVDQVVILSHTGIVFAALLLLALSVLNGVQIKKLVFFNYALFFLKVGIIVLVIFMILSHQFYSSNFSSMNSAFTLSGWHDILSAIATGGIMFALSFKHGIDLTGEVTSPERSIPFALVGAVVFCVLLYIGLQIAFIGAVDPTWVRQGWSHLHFPHDTGPLVGIVTLLGLSWMARLLYIDSIASPAGSGLVCTTSAARVIYAMSRSHYLPDLFSRVNKHHMPVYAIGFNFIIGLLTFLPFPGWQSMVNFFVSAASLTFAIGPIALLCLRKQLKDTPRSFKIRLAPVICFFAFTFCNLMTYWTGWTTVYKLSLGVIVGIIIFIISYFRKKDSSAFMGFRALVWLVPYLGGLVIISYLGAFGGKNIISFGWDFLVIGLFSALMLVLAVKTRLPEVFHYEQEDLI